MSSWSPWFCTAQCSRVTLLDATYIWPLWPLIFSTEVPHLLFNRAFICPNDVHRLISLWWDYHQLLISWCSILVLIQWTNQFLIIYNELFSVTQQTLSIWYLPWWGIRIIIIIIHILVTINCQTTVISASCCFTSYDCGKHQCSYNYSYIYVCNNWALSYCSRCFALLAEINELIETTVPTIVICVKESSLATYYNCRYY